VQTLQPVIANIIVLGLLVFLFGVVFLARPDDRFRCWIGCWLCILAHFATDLWSPTSALGLNLQASINVSSLAVAGIFLVVSTVVLAYGRRKGFLLGSLLAVTTLPCMVLAIAAPEKTWLLLTAVLARQAMALFLAVQDRSRRQRFVVIAVSACLVTGAWMVYGIFHGQPDVVLVALLAEIYFVTAVNFWAYNWHRTLALKTIVVGLVAWGAVFPTGMLVGLLWPHFAVSPVIWNIPKFCVALGMILVVLEEDSRAARHMADEYCLVFDQNPAPLWIFETATLKFLNVNQAALEKLRYTRDEFLRLSLTAVLPAGAAQQTQAELCTACASRALLLACKDGTVLPMDTTAYSIVFQGKPCRFVLAIDVTEREELQQQVVLQAHHDSLTGLPNRLLFQELLPGCVDESIKGDEKLAILCFDIDRFKRINDTYGVEVGDECLKRLAILLRARTRASDLVARSAGDEFSVVLTGIKSAASVEQAVSELREALAEPMLVQGYRISLCFSMGLSVCPEDGTDSMALWRGAESAQRRADDDGGDRIVWLSPELNRAADEQIELEAFMRLQLEQGGFNLVYQPFYAPDGSIRVVEALLRLHHPAHGAVCPGRFIPIAEESGLIAPLGQWVLEEVCRQLLAWRAAGNKPVAVAVNVSGLQLMHAGFARQVIATLERFGIDPRWIHLEITESVAMHDKAGVFEQMAILSAQGIEFSIDDFGTGHSSLGRLHNLPLSELKIDRSFVDRLCADGGTFSIVQAIISMAHALGHQVVAEGVETESQLACLRELDCDLFQGFLLSRPVAPGLIPGLVASGSSAFPSKSGERRNRDAAGNLDTTPAGSREVLMEASLA